MKIETDPKKNREQFEKLRAFSANNMLVFRKGFWLFMGFCFVVGSIFVFFGDQNSVRGATKDEAALISFGIGSGIILVTMFVSYTFNKIGEYTPRPNKGDEWKS